MKTNKKNIIAWILTHTIILTTSAIDLPTKPSVQSNCATTTSLVNDYVADVKYMNLLDRYIKELQRAINRYQAMIDRYGVDIAQNQTHIKALEGQLKVKKNSVITLQTAIQNLLANESVQFLGLNRALCRYEGAKTILMAYRILKLDKKYFEKAARLMQVAIDITEACGDPNKEDKQKSTLTTLQSAYGQESFDKQDAYSKRATKLFADIQLRILNEYLILTKDQHPYVTDAALKEKQPEAFPELNVEPPAEKAIKNLVKRATKSADPETLKRATAGFTDRLNTYIKGQEQDWLRAIALHKFGYLTCDCDATCKELSGQEKITCLASCPQTARTKMGWQKRDCEKSCIEIDQTCQKFNQDPTKCAASKKRCIDACEKDNAQRDINWNFCTACTQKPASCPEYQPLGFVDIQGQIEAFTDQIMPPEPGKIPSIANIPAKVDRLMQKIKQVTPAIEEAQKAIRSASDHIRNTVINSLLPTKSEHKKACAKSLQTLLKEEVNLTPAIQAAQQLVKEIEEEGKA